MKRNIKLTFIALLFVAIILVPIFGVSFYESPSIFEENAVVTNQKFGGGSSVYLSLDTTDDKILTKENLEKTAEILGNRFRERGYDDAKTTVVDQTVRLDFSQKTYIDSVMSSVASLGEWKFVGSDMTKTLCDASMVQDAYVSANAEGGYSITLKFTKDGKGEFFANTATYAKTGSYFYLMMDGQYAAMATISDSTVRDTFSFGSYEYSSAASLASIIKNGKLPTNVKVEKVETFEPTLGKTNLTLIYASLAAVLVLCIVAILMKGKLAGIFASLALLSNVAIFLTALANASYQLNFVTLSTMAAFIVLGTVFYIFAVADAGSSLKTAKTITNSVITKLNKFNVKVIWIHAAVLALALIGFLFAQGFLVYIVRIALLFACSNFILYFIFVYFGIKTLAEKN